MMQRLLAALVFLVMVASAAGATGLRIKDIADLGGMRDNQLVGYGLVIGLQGTGDSLRNAPFTEQAMRSMLEKMGINFDNATASTRNIAAVIVTANLPAFVSPGTRIDVTVSSLGDASSLMGGTLVLTPLMGADSEVYAVAQGPLAVAGFVNAGAAESVTQGVPTGARIPNGAIVERAVAGGFSSEREVVLRLRNPDFNTVIAMVDAVNRFTAKRYGKALARERSARELTVVRPGRVSAARFVAQIGRLTVEPDTPARIVIDERSGTIVIGRDVRISTVAVTHGNLTVRITEQPVVSQPPAFSGGETVVVPSTLVDAYEGDGQLALLPGSSLNALINGLNRIGLKPSGIIAILQAIKSAGALQAELVVQ
jgi:flagellar P-ring protein precursor FlgI